MVWWELLWAPAALRGITLKVTFRLTMYALLIIFALLSVACARIVVNAPKTALELGNLSQEGTTYDCDWIATVFP